MHLNKISWRQRWSSRSNQLKVNSRIFVHHFVIISVISVSERACCVEERSTAWKLSQYRFLLLNIKNTVLGLKYLVRKYLRRYRSTRWFYYEYVYHNVVAVVLLLKKLSPSRYTFRASQAGFQTRVAGVQRWIRLRCRPWTCWFLRWVTHDGWVESDAEPFLSRWLRPVRPVDADGSWQTILRLPYGMRSRWRLTDQARVQPDETSTKVRNIFWVWLYCTRVFVQYIKS